MAAKIPAFTEEEMVIDEEVRYPKAYAKLCRSGLNPYIEGPLLAFVPTSRGFKSEGLEPDVPHHPSRDETFCESQRFCLLWKQLDHVGNAGFDPGLFQVDSFSNVSLSAC